MPERIVRPGILTSEPVNSLSWAAEIFYRRLMSVVDDYGRFDGRDSVLRATLYPLKLDRVADADVGKWKLETAEAGLVSVYLADNKEFVEVKKFDQRLRGKPRWPEPDSKSPRVAASGGEVRPSSETETETETETVYTSGFSEWWKHWPKHDRKEGKQKCFRAWKERGYESKTKEILAALAHSKTTPDWTKNNGEFIPMPMTWLNRTPWETDPSERKSSPSNPGEWKRRKPTDDDFTPGASA
jgi:hypothetical protein